MLIQIFSFKRCNECENEELKLEVSESLFLAHWIDFVYRCCSGTFIFNPNLAAHDYTINRSNTVTKSLTCKHV